MHLDLNADQADSDQDGIGDACDRCPGGDDALDADGDEVPDVCDVCPVEDDTIDEDNDGIPDCIDTCPGKIGGDPDAPDADGDGIANSCDNCPDVANRDQKDWDEDGIGDVCDNCPHTEDPDQLDSDGDGIGDACEKGKVGKNALITQPVNFYSQLTASPNPFADLTTIRFFLPKAGPATLSIYNLQGQLVRQVQEGMLEAGDHQSQWDGADRSGARLPSGMYLLQLRMGKEVLTKKLFFQRL